MGSSRVIRLAGIEVHTLEQAVNALLRLPAQDQYEELSTQKHEFFEALDASHEQIALLCDIIDNPAIHNSLLTYLPARILRSEWLEAQGIRTQHRKGNKERIQLARNRASKVWSVKDTDRMWLYVKSRRVADQVNRMISDRLEFKDVQLAINNETVKRIAKSGQGISGKKGPTTGDIESARRNRCLDSIPADKLDQLHIMLDKEGFITSRPGKPKSKPPRQDHPPPTSSNHQQIDSEATTGTINEPYVGPEVVLELNQSRALQPTHTTQPDQNPKLHIVPGSPPVPGPKVNTPLIPRPASPQQLPTPASQAHKDANPASADRVDELSSESELSDLDSESEFSEPNSTSDINDQTNDTCKCRLPYRLQHALQKKGNLTNAKPVPLALLHTVSSKTEALDPKSICSRHLRLLAQWQGLQIHNVKDGDLRQRLQTVLQEREQIGNLKARDPFRLWFTKASRPAHPMDDLGVYQFHSSPPPTDFSHQVANLPFRELFYRCRGVLPPSEVEASITSAWSKDGSVLIPGLFDWLRLTRVEYPSGLDWLRSKGEEYPSSLLPLINTEYDMYAWHCRKIDGRSNLGWGRNQIHSLSQQLIRQDLAYYACYVWFRPDHAWRLISYPYYTKNTKEGEHTQFHHIDINVPRFLATGRGANSIQGSVSLSDENPQNCTEILPGFHHQLRSFWTDLQARVDEGHSKSKLTNGQIHGWDPLWSPEAAQRYQVDWTPQVCRFGDARITMATIPHGSTGPATMQRRTMLPWYVSIQADHEQLEFFEGGTWSQLSAAHRDLLPGPSTPSGHPVMYGKVPYAFPAALPISGTSAISDALVGRHRWDNPLVIASLRVLFGSNRDQARELIMCQRQTAITQFLHRFPIMMRLEEQAFGENSFFTYLHGLTARADTAISASKAGYASKVGYNTTLRQTSLDVPLTPPSTSIGSTALREYPPPQEDADLEMDLGIYPQEDQVDNVDIDEWIDEQGGLHVDHDQMDQD
ncbi:hypothetical protein N7494_001472 [Penicillium frequentans]|uniref:Uncharacterized protein n=1 Tax=Penicillium frequentans TaxID=3151616 RepID=A0AAD6D274_9EURO|nr:hypothetical protein N7494_001472 [Penicillium glabrum]